MLCPMIVTPWFFLNALLCNARNAYGFMMQNAIFFLVGANTSENAPFAANSAQ